MINLVALFFLYFKYASCASHTWDYPGLPENYVYADRDSYPDREEREISPISVQDKGASQDCPAAESFIPRDDLEVFIDQMMKDTVKIKDNLESYFKKELGAKSLKNGECAHERIEKLLAHMKKDQIKVKQLVQETIDNVEHVDGFDEQLLRITNRSQTIFARIQAYEKQCAHDKNIKNIRLLSRLYDVYPRTNAHGNKKKKDPVNEHNVSSKGICGSMKNIYSLIKQYLEQVQNQCLRDLLQFIEFVIKKNQDKIETSTYIMKRKVMLQYEMYVDFIIKLQDDYLHVKSNVSNFNVTKIIDDTNKNLVSTESILTELQKKVHEYAIKCVSNSLKDKHPGTGHRRTEELSDDIFVPKETNSTDTDTGYELLYQILHAKANVITSEIEAMITKILTEIEKSTDDPQISDDHLSHLNLNEMRKALEDLNKLIKSLEHSQFKKLQEQWKISYEILENAEKAKKLFNSRDYNEAMT